MKKTISVIALLLILSLLLAGCGRNDIEAKIKGTWDLVDATSSDAASQDLASNISLIRSNGASLTLTFDGKKMKMNMEYMGETTSNEMSYEISDEKLVTEEGSILDVKIDSDKMILSNEEGANSLTLQKHR